MIRAAALGVAVGLVCAASPALAQVQWLPCPDCPPGELAIPVEVSPWHPLRADPERVPVRTWTPVEVPMPGASLEVRLYQAVARGDLTGVKQLVELGARVEARDRMGMSPLAWAAQRGRTAIAAYLLSRRVNVNPVDHHGFTPLMWAAQEGRAEVAELLLQAGANPWVRTRSGITPLWLARYGRHPATVNLLQAWLNGRGRARAAALPTLEPRSVIVLQAPVRVPPAVSVTPGPVPQVAPTAAPPAVASAVPGPGAREQALLRLAQSANDFRVDYAAFLAGGGAAAPAGAFAGALGAGGLPGVPPAGVDAEVGRLLAGFYANVARTQDLRAARSDLDLARAAQGTERQCRFARYVVEADQALLAAGS